MVLAPRWIFGRWFSRKKILSRKKTMQNACRGGGESKTCFFEKKKQKTFVTRGV
jgi:hypothetical protein